jgi:hypothetical protein
VSNLPNLPTITANVPCLEPPFWALLERSLIRAMNSAVKPYLEKYTREDGSLIWGGTAKQHGRDDVDDFYEAFYNFPLLYLLGGGDHLLEIAHRQWDAITVQLGTLGLLEREFERGADFFHQGEGLLAFYFLCLADPTHPKLLERAQRFAGFYTGEDASAPNYDAKLKMIRAPHNGSLGPRWGYRDGDPVPDWSDGMRVYGLPFDDVPGVSSFDDLQDPELRRRLGEVMNERFGRGDVVSNLGATSLAANAFLMSGETKYRDWLLEYTSAWFERAAHNDGLIPDNVGLSGQVGEALQGRWYGGLYGWAWPHGFYNIGMSTMIAGSNAFLVSRDERYLELPRNLLERVFALGKTEDVRALEMSLAHHWLPQLGFDSLEAMRSSPESVETFVVPYRHGTRGWFDWQPVPPTVPAALWNLSMNASDWDRLEFLRTRDRSDWRDISDSRNKEDAGHEAPWLRFLAGDNPAYPERILASAHAQVGRRLEQIRLDDTDLETVTDDEVHTKVHHWQKLNPVTTEALVQLTLGGPQPVYNGGLLLTRIRYFDADRRRPGLPEDVAALVTKLEPTRTVLRLVNLNLLESRTLIVQAGAFAEHRFLEAQFTARTSEYPGQVGAYAAPSLETERQSAMVNGAHLRVILLPGCEIELQLETERFVLTPTYHDPWTRGVAP